MYFENRESVCENRVGMLCVKAECMNVLRPCCTQKPEEESEDLFFIPILRMAAFLWQCPPFADNGEAAKANTWQSYSTHTIERRKNGGALTKQRMWHPLLDRRRHVTFRLVDDKDCMGILSGLHC